MKVAVIVPVHNAGHRLADALTSIQSQSVQPSQVVVVDDGSTDGAVLDARKNFPGFEFVFQKQAGPSAARNAAIAQTDAEFISFLDADDRWLANHLEQSLALLLESKAAAVISNRFDFFEASSQQLVPAEGFKTDHNNPELSVDALLDLLHAGFYFCQSSVVVKRSHIGEGYRNDMWWGEDLEFFLRLTVRSTVCLYNPERTVCYRQDSPNGLSRDYANVTLGQYRALKSIAPLLLRANTSHQQILERLAVRSLLVSTAYWPRYKHDSIQREVADSLSLTTIPLLWSSKLLPRFVGSIYRWRYRQAEGN